jgi:hypothetical protein
MNEFFLDLAREAGFIVEGNKIVGEVGNIEKLLELYKKALAEY